VQKARGAARALRLPLVRHCSTLGGGFLCEATRSTSWLTLPPSTEQDQARRPFAQRGRRSSLGLRRDDELVSFCALVRVPCRSTLRPPPSGVLPYFPGELRLRLCRRKVGGYFGTTKSFAGAGIFIKNVVEFMAAQSCSVYKGFSLWTNDETPECCGVIMLKMARLSPRASPRASPSSPPLPELPAGQGGAADALARQTSGANGGRECARGAAAPRRRPRPRQSTRRQRRLARAGGGGRRIAAGAGGWARGGEWE